LEKLHQDEYEMIKTLSHFILVLLALQAQYNEGLPMLLMGCIAVLTGISSFSLPETLDQPLTETLEELG